MSNDAPIESPIHRQQSLEQFPLPPTTPNKVVYTTKSSPDLNRDFRFPPISYMPQAPTRSNTTRQRPAPFTPDAKIRNQHVEPEEKTPIEQTIKAVSELLHGRAISPPAILQPLQYNPPPAGIPFSEFSDWDLDEEENGSDLDGEDLILAHTSNRSNLPAPAVSIRPDEEGLPGPVRKYLLAQERDRVLRETKIAEISIVDAGFDFGFGKPETSAPSKVPVPHIPIIEVQHPTPLSEKSPESPCFPPTRDSFPDSETILPHSDSGVAIDSKTVFKTISPLQHKSYHDFGQPKKRDQKVWRLTPSPDLGQETLRERKHANDARMRRGSMGGLMGTEGSHEKQRSGFWGKMKKSVFLRKG